MYRKATKFRMRILNKQAKKNYKSFESVSKPQSGALVKVASGCVAVQNKKEPESTTHQADVRR